MARSRITNLLSLLVLVTPVVAGCASDKLEPGVSEYGVASLERAMADFTPTYYEPANKEEAEEIARQNRQAIAEVKRLIRGGAMVNHQRRGNGHTPLHVAVQLASSQLVRILLDAGARLDIKGETARGPMTPLEYADFLEEKVPGYAFEKGQQLLREAERERSAQGGLPRGQTGQSMALRVVASLAGRAGRAGRALRRALQDTHHLVDSATTAN